MTATVRHHAAALAPPVSTPVSTPNHQPGRRALAPLVALALLAGAVATPGASADEIVRTEHHAVRVEVVTEGLRNPWAIAFLPDGSALVTERGGQLRLVGADGRLDPRPIGGVPPVAARGQGGLLDVALHPGFAGNGWVYLSYAGERDGLIGTEVARGRLRGHALEDVEVLFEAQPKSRGGRHFGSRLRFAPDGRLIVTLGDRGDRARAQDLADHAGSVIRLADDGAVPGDNPLVTTPGARPEILTYGNRNVQGLAVEPGTGALWATEHGPQGGDEVNVLRAGTNYGWPVITYGRNYGIGTRIGEGESRPGMAQPVIHWTPSIAPSGLAFYTGDRFPAWRGNLFAGALKYELLVRMEVHDGRVVHQERLLEGLLGRIRDVRNGPDGLLYLLTDARDGALVRLVPAD